MRAGKREAPLKPSPERTMGAGVVIGHRRQRGSCGESQLIGAVT